MRPVRILTVVPALPPELRHLGDIAYNLRWAWHHETIELFRQLDRELWESSGHNPVRMLELLPSERLAEAARDEAFLRQFEAVLRELEEYLATPGWFGERMERMDGRRGPAVAYFSAEFGITDCLPIFAGGLGALAGDHLKSASDLGLPLVGVGLLYQHGYFRQRLNEAGRQQEIYDELDFSELPIRMERDGTGEPLLIQVPYLGRPVRAHVWRADVGRVPLYLLDANVSENAPEDRAITNQLYGGDHEQRFRQEIVLGIGGAIALSELGLDPPVWHMNEGHSAFAALERIRQLMTRRGVPFEAAVEAVRAGMVFTTHTPVESGHDSFPGELVGRYFAPLAEELGLSMDELLALGRGDGRDPAAPFAMTVLALRLSSSSNGVSRLHGAVSRNMWRHLWPGLPEAEVPIGHVTNGVHLQSWISLELNDVYDRYLGSGWRERPPDVAVWARARDIPAEELWQTQEFRRERLVAAVRRRLREQLERLGVPRPDVEAAERALDPKALTVVAARRFAPYKRMTLLLRDPDRLARLVTDPERPVQFVFAGKAHPRDAAGKDMLAQVAALAQLEPFRGRLVFAENYDLALARTLLQGADVWLNTPRPPLEASGTSGMKAVANGALHLSTLDGWWAEAWEDRRRDVEPAGWAIGRHEPFSVTEAQDAMDAEAVYALLEREIVPLFYERHGGGPPLGWVERMKTAIAELCPRFNTHRMVEEYADRFYLPTLAKVEELVAGDLGGARALAGWRDRVRQYWSQVAVEEVRDDAADRIAAGDRFGVKARIRLGELRPEDVAVEAVIGRVNAAGEITSPNVVALRHAQADGDGTHWFEAPDAPVQVTGRLGYTVRVLARTPADGAPVPGCITWTPPA